MTIKMDSSPKNANDVVPNLYGFISSAEHKRRYYEELFLFIR